MAGSKIEWTDRSDWNPIRGCTRVSPGCGGPGNHGGCYAEAMAGRFSDRAKDGKPAQWGHGYAERTSKGGRWTGKVELLEERLTLPLRWRRPAKVFPSSTSDIFHEELSDGDIDRIFAVMALAPHLTFQILTKRADRMRRYFTAPIDGHLLYGRLQAIQDAAYRMMAMIHGRWDEARGEAAREAVISALKRVDDRTNAGFANVWLGVSVEDQQRADERREDLRNTPAAIRFVSYEPALGPVDWSGWEFVDQIIGGGESGPRARPTHPNWHRATRDFCAAHDIAYFFKQHGEWVEVSAERHHADYIAAANGKGPWRGDQLIDQDGTILPGTSMQVGSRVYVRKVGKKAAGRLLDGVEHSAFPTEHTA